MNALAEEIVTSSKNACYHLVDKALATRKFELWMQSCELCLQSFELWWQRALSCGYKELWVVATKNFELWLQRDLGSGRRELWALAVESVEIWLQRALSSTYRALSSGYRELWGLHTCKKLWEAGQHLGKFSPIEGWLYRALRCPFGQVNQNLLGVLGISCAFICSVSLLLCWVMSMCNRGCN